MKRFIFLTAIAVVLSFLAGACQSTSAPLKVEENALLSVITTSGIKKESTLHFFDDELNVIGSYHLPYASVGNHFYVPEIQGHDLFLPTHGYAHLKDEEHVLHIDLSELNCTPVFVGQPGINCVSLQNGFLYTCNTLNNISYISKVDLSGEKVENALFPQIYMTKLISDETFLYAFGTVLAENLSSSLYILDQNMDVVDTVDLTGLGITQYKAVQDEDYLYFSNPVDSQDRPTNRIGCFNKKSREIQSFTLDHFMPNDLLIYNDTLLIAHYNPVTAESDGITLFDLNTEIQTHLPLSHGIEQMVRIEDSLYILFEKTIYEYHVEDTNLERIRQGSLPPTKEGEYTGGMFKLP